MAIARSSKRAESKPIASPVGRPNNAARAMNSLRRIVHGLRIATRASESAFGVSTAQLFVLRQLSAAPGQSLGALAARTRTTQSSISEVVARLVRRGLVTRGVSKGDRRRAELTLTEAGRIMLASAPETVQERLLHGFDKLDESSRAALAEHLESWLAAAGLDEVAPTMFFEGPDSS